MCDMVLYKMGMIIRMMNEEIRFSFKSLGDWLTLVN